MWPASGGGRHRGRYVAAPILLGCGYLIGIESAQAAPAPAREEIGPASPLAFVFLPLQPIGDVEEGAEQGGAVVIQQLDKAGFLHEAAQLDEVACALAPQFGPVARVRAGAGGVQPMPLHY